MEDATWSIDVKMWGSDFPGCRDCPRMSDKKIGCNKLARLLFDKTDMEPIAGSRGKMITAEQARVAGAEEELKDYKMAVAEVVDLGRNCPGATAVYSNGETTIECGMEV